MFWTDGFNWFNQSNFCWIIYSLFAKGPTNWGQIITLFYFGYRLVMERMRSGVVNAFYQVCKCLISFCRQVNIFTWIAYQGGWVSLRKSIWIPLFGKIHMSSFLFIFIRFNISYLLRFIFFEFWFEFMFTFIFKFELINYILWNLVSQRWMFNSFIYYYYY